MRFLLLLLFCVVFVASTLNGRDTADPFGVPDVPAPPKKEPVLRFGRTDSQLFEIYSKCSAGTNIDFSLSDEESRELEKYKASCLEFIKSEPDIPMILVDYLDRNFSGQGFEINVVSGGTLIAFLRALALRPDVDVKVVQRYAQMANELLDKSCSQLPMSSTEANLNAVFIYGLTDLLGSYSSREGGNYLVKLLEHSMDGAVNDYAKLAAARAATKLGDACFLPGMEQTLREFRQMHERLMKSGNSESKEMLREIENLIKELREKIAKSEQISK
jgi:hypothetical protein